MDVDLTDTATSHVLTWGEVNLLARTLAERWCPNRAAGEITAVHGVPRGGSVPGVIVAGILDLPLVGSVDVGPHTLVVDDLVDSGATAVDHLNRSPHFDSLVRKPWSPSHLAPLAEEVTDGAWVVFPWETALDGPERNVVRLLEYLGEDPTRDGLLATPGRVVRALAEMTAGYRMDPAAILGTTFDVAYDEMVLVRDIPFTSLCEHHLLTFTGHATIGYLPGDRVVGLSKLARLVECFARRLQVQERLTRQVAEAIAETLAPKGVGVIIEATHSCMSARGVGKVAPMVTSSMLGAFRDNPAARAEFLALAR